MELLRGETLAQRIEKGPLPMSEALRIAEDVAKGLAHAHQRGVLHRDLKPANVFLCEDGRVKLLDFGLAHLLGHPRDRGAGTPAYMAPEQARGDEVDERCDVYSAGKVLEEMLGERRPHRLDQAVALATFVTPAARPRDGTAWLDLLQAARRAAERPSRIRRLALIAGTGIILGAAVAGLAVRRSFRPPESTLTSPPPSIAVLPFADMSPGKDQEYFSDGIAEEILNALAHVEGLRVIGRTSSFSFKGKNARLADIGRELRVGAVLEGGVRKEGGRVRITAQLLNVADESHLWSESYDREMADILALQEQIARAVAQALKVKLLPGRGPAALGHGSIDPEAFKQYLLAQRSMASQTAADLHRAEAAYERAVALAPGFAAAWVGLSGVRFGIADSESRTPAALEEGLAQALEAVDKAIALEPLLAEGYAVRGEIRLMKWDWEGGRVDIEHALALNPGERAAILRYALVEQIRGRLPEAVRWAQRATELDPLWPRGWWKLAGLYNNTGQFELARAAAARALELDPEGSWSRVWGRVLAFTYLLEGRPAEALAASQRCVPPFGLEIAAMAHHDMGNSEESRRALDALIAEEAHSAAYQIAAVYAWRGERDRAFEWLDRAYTQRDTGMAFLKSDSLLRKLRDDPRYTALLRKMNLPVD